MDTISRESNTSYLPWAGAILGGLGLVLALVAFLKLNSLSKEVAEARTAAERVSSVESQVNNLSQLPQRVEGVQNYAADVAQKTNTAFQTVAGELNKIGDRVTKLEQGRPTTTAGSGTRTAGTAGTTTTPPVAGPDEYVVKGGDTGVKIANANGVSLSALMAVNPDVDWSRLKIGQKVKLPKK